MTRNNLAAAVSERTEVFQGRIGKKEFRILLVQDELVYQYAEIRPGGGALVWKRTTEGKPILELMARSHGRLLRTKATTVATKITKPNAWSCEGSPDGYCHYFTEPSESGNGRVVRLYTSDIWNAPASHAHQRENSDCCLFCEEPEERK